MEGLSLERYFRALLVGYILASLYGAVWVSDEFDAERAIIYGFFTIPLTVFFFAFGIFVRDWQSRFRPLYQTCVLGLLLAHVWGNLLLLNFIGGRDPHVVRMAIVEHQMNVAYKKGGFGWLYRERW